MANAILADFLAFNDLVAGLARAGVSLHLGLPRKGAAEACEQIGAVVARRVGEGASLQEALRDRAVPEAYRCVAQLAMISGDPEAALGEAGREVVCDDDSRALWAALRYPLMVCGLAYVGMILFCVLLAPLLNDAYQWMEVSVGWGMAAVNWLRAAMPYWVVGAPLLLLAIIVYIRYSRASGARASTDRPLGGSQAVFDERLARFADMLAAYLDAGAAMPEALEAASAVWEEGVLKHTAMETVSLLRSAESQRSGEAAIGDNPLASRLPPLLRWAMWRAEPIERPRALQMAADVYRQAAQRRRRRHAILRPMAACVLIGGAATLFYALALFLPVTQLLQGLAR